MPSLSDPIISLAHVARETAIHIWQSLPGARPDSPLASRIGLWITLLTLVAVFFLTLSILILNLRNDWNAKRRKRWIARWLPQLMDPETLGPIQPLRPSQLQEFQTLWNHVHDSMRGDVRTTLITASRRAGAIPLSLDRLRRGSMSQRILSAIFLGNHGERDAIEPLASIVSDPDPFLSLSAARSLIQIDPIAQVPLLIQDLLRRETWPLPVVYDIVASIDPELRSSHLREALMNWQPEPTPRGLRLLPLVHENARAAIIDSLAERSPPLQQETLAALLREIRSPHQLPLVRSGLESSHWPVVVAALNTLALLGSREDVPKLLELLGHKEWWIRYRAARALVMLPDMKPIEVELLASRHGDRYGREMLRYALSERNMR